MRTCISIGEYTTTPYFIPGLEIPVYCIEELCYCMKENAFLLDTTLMNDGLTEWIDDKCGLEKLAEMLHPLIHKQGSMSTFVVMILEYTGLYDSSVVRSVEQVLKEGAGLSAIEKRKRQVDYLVEKKKYVSALRGYDALLAKWEKPAEEGGEFPAAEVKAGILHNKGVTMAHLMRYGQAAECFRQAAELTGAEEHRVSYLAAKRMELSEEEYISFAAGLHDSYDSALMLESTMQRAQEEWEEHVTYRRLAIRKGWREGSDKQKYYEENERLTRALKDNYRDSVEAGNEFLAEIVSEKA